MLFMVDGYWFWQASDCWGAVKNHLSSLFQQVSVVVSLVLLICCNVHIWIVVFPHKLFGFASELQLIVSATPYNKSFHSQDCAILQQWLFSTPFLILNNDILQSKGARWGNGFCSCLVHSEDVKLISHFYIFIFKMEYRPTKVPVPSLSRKPNF